MKAVSLLYHDAIESDNFDESGFPGWGAAVYKLDVDDMQRHFAAAAAAQPGPPSDVTRFLGDFPPTACPFFLTFDDGGVSAATHIASALEPLGWIGHFFVTAGSIGDPAFVSATQIRQLRQQGHVVGSHTWSHPPRMSECAREVLENEWTTSVSRLSEILGEPVTVASVPGGHYSENVAKAASACGIRALFTSEPVKRAYRVHECLVLGRYSLKRGMAPEVSGALASNRMSLHQMKQYVLWNSRKIAKTIGGSYYLTLRERILKRREGA